MDGHDANGGKVRKISPAYVQEPGRLRGAQKFRFDGWTCFMCLHLVLLMRGYSRLMRFKGTSGKSVFLQSVFPQEKARNH